MRLVRLGQARDHTDALPDAERVHPEGDPMASSSLLNRVKAFFASPQGRRLIDQGRRDLARPGNQSRLRTLFSRFSRPR
jgi:hypothetical protein